MFQFIQSLLRWHPAPTDKGEVILTNETIGVRNTTSGEIIEMRWDEISRITIVTTDQGPFVEDVFFVFEGKGPAMIVSHEDAVRLKLNDALDQHLIGIDYEQAIEAMTCTENNSFIIFERQRGA